MRFYASNCQAVNCVWRLKELKELRKLSEFLSPKEFDRYFKALIDLLSEEFNKVVVKPTTPNLTGIRLFMNYVQRYISSDKEYSLRCESFIRLGDLTEGLSCEKFEHFITGAHKILSLMFPRLS